MIGPKPPGLGPIFILRLACQWRAGRRSVSMLAMLLATLMPLVPLFFPKLAMLLSTTVPALAVTEAKTAFVQTRAIPAVDVETNRDIVDR